MKRFIVLLIVLLCLALFFPNLLVNLFEVDYGRLIGLGLNSLKEWFVQPYSFGPPFRILALYAFAVFMVCNALASIGQHREPRMPSLRQIEKERLREEEEREKKRIRNLVPGPLYYRSVPLPEGIRLKLHPRASHP